MGALTADPFYVGGSPRQTFDIESLAKGFDGIYKDGPMHYGKKLAIPYHQLRNVSYANDYVKHLVAVTKREMAGYIAEEMGNRQYNIQFHIHTGPPIDDFDAVYRIVVQAYVEPTRIETVRIPEPVAVTWRDEKRRCHYCGGFTPDDERGNWGVCGAPRRR